ncbi:MAG TPA: hypothetical protein VD970_05220 [Acetobacteraceae bacterium]|nr:hypothetical protein [Acetobacteraceae bacterium]
MAMPPLLRAALVALPLGLAACDEVVLAGGPAPVAPAQYYAPPPPPPYYAPRPPRRVCWVERRRVWVRDAWGRPVPVVQRRRVCDWR